jgi:hypothetical protein
MPAGYTQANSLLSSSPTSQPDSPVGSSYDIGALSGLIANDASVFASLRNSQAINDALSGAFGVAVISGGLGAVYIRQTLNVPSYGTLKVGAGTFLKRIPNVTNYALVANKYAQHGSYVNGLTITSAGFITVPAPGHSRAIGDLVFMEGFLGNTTLNGLKIITAIVPGVSFTFAASGTAPTNTSAQLAFACLYNPIQGASLTRVTNVVTVQEPGHTRGVGDHVYIGRTGLASTNAFGGAQEITSIVQGVSWTYANTGANETATGATVLLGDRGIEASLRMDGNGANVSITGWGAHASLWINCSNSILSAPDSKNIMYGRVIAPFNAASISIPRIYSSDNCAVGVQFDSFCTRCEVGTVDGKYSDDLVAWGTTSASGAFGDTTSPTGPGDMGTLTVHSLLGNSPTGLLKMFATTGYTAGDVNVDLITGTGPVTIGDGTSGVGGGTFKTLTIGRLASTPGVNVGAFGVGGGSSWASVGDITIGEFVDNPTGGAADTAFGITVIAPFKTLHVGKLTCKVTRTGAAVLANQNNGDLISIGMLQGLIGGSVAIVNLALGTVTNLVISGGVCNGASIGNGFLVYAQGGGAASNINISNLVMPAGACVFYNASSPGLTWNINMDNCNINNVASGINGGGQTGTYNIRTSGVQSATISNNWLQFGTAGQVSRWSSTNDTMPAGKYLLNGAVGTTSLNGVGIKADFGASGANLLTYLAGAVSGDQVTNTNATGPGIYTYKGSSTSWVLTQAT